VDRRELLAAYLDTCREDELIEAVLLPLFRQLGYHRITAVAATVAQLFARAHIVFAWLKAHGK
jgi:hypothetical protein